LRFSQGSVAELETQILICCNPEFVYKEQADPLLAELEEISRMIVGLQRSLT
jgi:four helix bundle protein